MLYNNRFGVIIFQSILFYNNSSPIDASSPSGVAPKSLIFGNVPVARTAKSLICNECSPNVVKKCPNVAKHQLHYKKLQEVLFTAWRLQGVPFSTY